MNGAASDHTDGPRNRPALSALRSANTRNRSTMAADALTAIRDAIIFGDIPPGAPLRLEHVADSLGMSASPVREAIRQLENLGLAESIPYRGSRVTSLDLDEMRDIYDLRLAVETVSGRWAAERLTTEHESRLEDVLEKLDVSNHEGDIRGAVQGNTEFHTLLAVASQSQWAVRALRPLLETTQRYSAFVQRSFHRVESIDIEAASHREILAACAARDPDAAAAALQNHLEAFRHEYEIAFGVLGNELETASTPAAPGR